MTGVLQQVAQLELALLLPAVRADPTRLESLLHPDFVEVGASGRRWSRDEVIAALISSPDPGDVAVDDIDARLIAHDVVLVTYTSRRATTVVHRCSIWIRSGGDWVARHHQGTPVWPPGPPGDVAPT
jgi:ribonuclease HI